jgi:hypothetical protein
MSVYKTLGKYTATKQAFFGTLGRGLDAVLRGGARLAGRGFARPGVLPKLLTAGGIGAAAGAANEGLAYAKLPHFKLDNDPMWSPHLNGVRGHLHPSILGQLGEFFKRPIQSLTGNQSPHVRPYEALSDIGQMPESVIKNMRIGPDGNPILDLNGSMQAPFAGSYMDMLKQHRQWQNNIGNTGLGGAGVSGILNQAPQQPKPQIRYIYGAPGLPSSSTV